MPLDLDKARAERAAKRAAVAEREGRGDGEPIILDGHTIATLPPELPFNALTPLAKINEEIALLLGQAMRMQQGGQAIEGAQLALDLLSTNGNLPVTLVEVVHDIATAVLGVDGLAAFMASRPTLQDIGVLAGGVFNFYGVSLGESSRSAASSQSAGPNSEPTSPASTGSTPAASSEPLALPGSSDSATSTT